MLNARVAQRTGNKGARNPLCTQTYRMGARPNVKRRNQPAIGPPTRELHHATQTGRAHRPHGRGGQRPRPA
eukprot:129744-Lingulodinium_polyedra.AAC.1